MLGPAVSGALIQIGGKQSILLAYVTWSVRKAQGPGKTRPFGELSLCIPRRPKGHNLTARWPPVGGSAQELQYHAFVSFGDRPRAPDTIYRKAARACRPMKACPWLPAP